MNEKYPPWELAPDHAEKVQEVPREALWAEENEPILCIPDGTVLGRPMPYSVALRYGLIRPKE